MCAKEGEKEGSGQGGYLKIIRKNSQIYLDVIDKLSTFAPALLERQSLMIDILL